MEILSVLRIYIKPRIYIVVYENIVKDFKVG